MPNTADIKVWKDTLNELQNLSEMNEIVIHEVQEEIALQEERKKEEVQKLYEKVKAQEESLEALQKTLDTNSLFPLPVDQQAKDSFVQSVDERLANTRALLEATRHLLDSPTTSKETLAKLHGRSLPAPASASSGADKASQSVKEEPVKDNSFPQQALLGNWIHYFQKDMFTCQCFWDDGEFKEYDFIDGSLVEERTGTFRIADRQVVLRFSDGKKTRYTITGYSDDCLDYLIDDTPIRFDYMPEDLLNALLEDSPRVI